MQDKKVKNNIRKSNKINADRKVAAFFGKLPGIEDGLSFQKKLRNSWK